MSAVIKETDNGVLVAYTRVAAPGYTIYVDQVDENTTLPDGWVYIADDVALEDFLQPWSSELPYDVGVVVKHSGKIWRSLLNNNVWEPGVTGWREELPESIYPDWVQPLGAHDAWPKDARVMHSSNAWVSLVENNVWEPGIANWRQLVLFVPSGPSIPEWIQPTWAGDAYQLGDRVTHSGATWESTAANNVWEPGVYGWIQV